MQFDIVWLLLSLPLAFVLGWAASRFDFQQLRIQNRRSPRAYFRGVGYLFQNQPDAALEQFEQAVRNDPDTPELQFALGHLYRERAQYSAAVRIHQHLAMRADIQAADRHRAQYALALDYVQAGILDRAEQALALLEGTSYQAETRTIRLAIFERLRDWEPAQVLAQALAHSEPETYHRRLAHYLCEQAAGAEASAAIKLLRQAHKQDSKAPRPMLELAQLCLSLGMDHAAAEVLQLVQEVHRPYLSLLAANYTEVWLQADAETQALYNLPEILFSAFEEQPTLDLLQALLRLQHAGLELPEPDRLYEKYWQHQPSLLTAGRWLRDTLEAEAPQIPIPASCSAATVEAEKPLLRYRCSACGFEAEKHYWHCPGCQAWDSYPPQRVENLQGI